MTIQVDSQPVTDRIMWYITMPCINNSFSCLEKKTTFGTHDQTLYVDFNVGFSLPPFFILVDLSRACFLDKALNN